MATGGRNQGRGKLVPPLARVETTVATGRLLGNLRRSLKIRQADLAVQAGVGQQWLVAMQLGKTSLEIGLVLRTLEALGFAVKLRPVDPLPPWIFRAKHDAAPQAAAIQQRRRARRATRREANRLCRQATNLPKVPVELE